MSLIKIRNQTSVSKMHILCFVSNLKGGEQMVGVPNFHLRRVGPAGVPEIFNLGREGGSSGMGFENDVSF